MESSKAVFQAEFLDDLAYWYATDQAIASRIVSLLHVILNGPDNGEGKPVELHPLGNGLYSRRIAQEHRLVYWIESGNEQDAGSVGKVHFLQSRYHYQSAKQNVDAFSGT